MAWYRAQQTGGGGGEEGVPLINESVWIATSSNARTKNRVNDNNYIEINGNTANLYRNNSSYGLVIRLPSLKANTQYKVSFDEETLPLNHDMLYLAKVTSLTETTMNDSRIGMLRDRSVAFFTTTTAGDYSILIYGGNTQPYKIVNPRLIEIGAAPLTMMTPPSAPNNTEEGSANE